MMRLADGAVRRLPFTDGVPDVELIPGDGEVQAAERDAEENLQIAIVKHAVRLRDPGDQRCHIAVRLLLGGQGAHPGQ